MFVLTRALQMRSSQHYTQPQIFLKGKWTAMTSPSQGIVGNVNNIPPELRQLPFFVVRKGKLPYNPRTGKLARTNQPDTWCSFEEAVEAVSSGAYDGIGIVIPKDSGLAGSGYCPWSWYWLDWSYCAWDHRTLWQLYRGFHVWVWLPYSGAL